MRASALFLVLLGGLLTGGCDTSIDAFSETGGVYSVFGYLDASAGTQWVRVEPLRDSVLLGAEPFEARVVTENLATGEQIVWRDSLFDLGAGVVVQNYYTTAQVVPEATYRFTVEGPSGRSTAEVTLPPDFPVPTYMNPPDSGAPGSLSPTIVVVEGVERLGAVLALYRYRACAYPPGGPPICRDRTARVSHLDDAVRRADGAYRITIEWAADLTRLIQEPFGLVNFYSFQVTVASVSEDWPDYDAPIPDPGEEPPDDPLPLPGADTNVENGVGFLGGAVTKTVDIPIVE